MGVEKTPPSSHIFDSCPHCGMKLSPWQQVLLGVDRALMCRNCWYRITLDVDDEQGPESSGNQKPTSQK